MALSKHPFRRRTARFRRYLHRSTPLQIGMILGLGLLGMGLTRFTNIPLPSGVTALLLTLGLLAAGLIRFSSLRKGAAWVILQMMVFFVPASLCIVDHPEFFGVLGLKLLAILILGNFCVLAVTAFAVDWSAKAFGGSKHG